MVRGRGLTKTIAPFGLCAKIDVAPFHPLVSTTTSVPSRTMGSCGNFEVIARDDCTSCTR
jgi:hypothetical protein